MRRFPSGPPPAYGGIGVSIGEIDMFRCQLGGGPVSSVGPATGSLCVAVCRATDALHATVGDCPTMVIPAGHLTVIRNDVQHVLRSRSTSQITGMIIPVSVLSAFSVRPPAEPLMTFGSVTLAAPMWQFMDSLLDQPLPWPPLPTYFAEKLLHELIGSVLLDATGAQSVDVPDRSLVERARHHILAYARDPRLTPGTIAASLNVPLRRLQRRFADNGTSIAQEIRAARAAAAVDLLASPEASLLTMEAVAEYCGYPNAVSLRRAFAALGMESPMHYRSVGRARVVEMTPRHESTPVRRQAPGGR